MGPNINDPKEWNKRWGKTVFGKKPSNEIIVRILRKLAIPHKLGNFTFSQSDVPPPQWCTDQPAHSLASPSFGHVRGIPCPICKGTRRRTPPPDTATCQICTQGLPEGNGSEQACPGCRILIAMHMADSEAVSDITKVRSNFATQAYP